MKRKHNRRSYLGVLPPIGATRSLYLLTPEEFKIATRNNCMVKNIDVHDFAASNYVGVPKASPRIQKKQLYTDTKSKKISSSSLNSGEKDLPATPKRDFCFENALIFGNYISRRRSSWYFKLQEDTLEILLLAKDLEKPLSEEELSRKKRELKRLKRDFSKSSADFQKFFGLYPYIHYGSRIDVLAHEYYVPSEKFLPAEGRFNPLPKEKNEKYFIRKKKAKKRTQIRKANRKLKQQEREYYMCMSQDERDSDYEDWSYFDEPKDFGDAEHYLDFAYNKFVNAPCTVEAAWAIFEGADSVEEHINDVIEAEMLYMDYINALIDARPL